MKRLEDETVADMIPFQRRMIGDMKKACTLGRGVNSPRMYPNPFTGRLMTPQEYFDLHALGMYILVERGYKDAEM